MWASGRTAEQAGGLDSWLEASGGPRPATVGPGAGSVVPTGRMTSERVARSLGAIPVRIDLREPRVPPGHLDIPLGARAALEAIERRRAEAV